MHAWGEASDALVPRLGTGASIWPCDQRLASDPGARLGVRPAPRWRSALGSAPFHNRDVFCITTIMTAARPVGRFRSGPAAGRGDRSTGQPRTGWSVARRWLVVWPVLRHHPEGAPDSSEAARTRLFSLSLSLKATDHNAVQTKTGYPVRYRDSNSPGPSAGPGDDSSDEAYDALMDEMASHAWSSGSSISKPVAAAAALLRQQAAVAEAAGAEADAAGAEAEGTWDRSTGAHGTSSGGGGADPLQAAGTGWPADQRAPTQVEPDQARNFDTVAARIGAQLEAVQDRVVTATSALHRERSINLLQAAPPAAGRGTQSPQRLAPRASRSARVPGGQGHRHGGHIGAGCCSGNTSRAASSSRAWGYSGGSWQPQHSLTNRKRGPASARTAGAMTGAMAAAGAAATDARQRRKLELRVRQLEAEKHFTRMSTARQNLPAERVSKLQLDWMREREPVAGAPGDSTAGRRRRHGADRAAAGQAVGRRAGPQFTLTHTAFTSDSAHHSSLITHRSLPPVVFIPCPRETGVHPPEPWCLGVHCCGLIH